MSRGNVLSVFMPYCLERLKDGRYLVVNREYKPVGFFSEEPIPNREQYPVACAILGITPEVAAKLSWNGDANIDKIYLHDGYGGDPKESKQNMDDYLERLRILATLKLKPHP